MTVKLKLLDQAHAKIRLKTSPRLENRRLWLGLNAVVGLATTAREAA